MEDQPLPLDFKEQPNPPPRPTWQHEAVRRAAAIACLDGEVIAWAGVDYKPDDREQWIDDLARVMCEDDGYAAARSLENRHWAVNFDLCEILDGSWIHAAERAAVKIWVAHNCIKPKFEIGTIVQTPHGSGEIVGIDVAQATYTVQTDKFLAKAPSQISKAGGYVIAFENATLPKET